MKRISFIACGVALLFLVATVFAEDKKQTEPADAQAKVAELAKQVDALQAKIKVLDQRLAKLEQERPIVTPTPITGGAAITVPGTLPNFAVLLPDGTLGSLTNLPGATSDRNLLEQGFADPNHPPKIWGEGECNGWKYYMIPLSAAQGGAVTPIPLAGEALAGH